MLHSGPTLEADACPISGRFPASHGYHLLNQLQLGVSRCERAIPRTDQFDNAINYGDMVGLAHYKVGYDLAGSVRKIQKCGQCGNKVIALQTRNVVQSSMSCLLLLGG